MTPTSAPSASGSVLALLPLAVLAAVRGLDAPVPDELDEFHGELSAKRLGLNRTVAAEIERLERLGAHGLVRASELAALLRLVSRRQDAALVFSDAGRRAARAAVKLLPTGTRPAQQLLPRRLRVGVGFRLTRRLAGRVFGLHLRRDGRLPRSEFASAVAEVFDRGAPCSFFGSGVAELLRQLTDFEGAMVHVHCRARGDDSCIWRAAVSHD